MISMGNAAAQMIQLMAQQGEGLDPKVVEVLKDEIGKIMNEEFIENRFINDMSYDVYHKYFSLSELREFVAV